MKGWPAYVVVAAVVVAVVANIMALGRGKALSDARELAELRDSVAALTSRVNELRVVILELQGTLNPPAVPADLPEGAFPPEEPEPEIKLPSSGEVNADPVDVVLTIDEAGVCTLKGRSIERDKLGAELKRILNANPAMQLVVRAHKETPLSEVTAILQTARDAGIYRVSLATRPGEEEEEAPESPD